MQCFVTRTHLKKKEQVWLKHFKHFVMPEILVFFCPSTANTIRISFGIDSIHSFLQIFQGRKASSGNCPTASESPGSGKPGGSAITILCTYIVSLPKQPPKALLKEYSHPTK